MTISILFVCMGNICRSPLAEASLRAEAPRVGLEIEVDSAGTGSWHVGEPPDRRAQAVALRSGIDISGMRARQVSAEDFHRFDHVIALDADNLALLKALRPLGSRARVSMLLDYLAGREGEAVADPYYGGADEFDRTWAEVSAATKALARRLAERR